MELSFLYLQPTSTEVCWSRIYFHMEGSSGLNINSSQININLLMSSVGSVERCAFASHRSKQISASKVIVSTTIVPNYNDDIW